jgi:hypothetical protein
VRVGKLLPSGDFGGEQTLLSIGLSSRATTGTTVNVLRDAPASGPAPPLEPAVHWPLHTRYWSKRGSALPSSIIDKARLLAPFSPACPKLRCFSKTEPLKAAADKPVALSPRGQPRDCSDCTFCSRATVRSTPMLASPRSTRTRLVLSGRSARSWNTSPPKTRPAARRLRPHATADVDAPPRRPCSPLRERAPAAISRPQRFTRINCKR